MMIQYFFVRKFCLIVRVNTCTEKYTNVFLSFCLGPFLMISNAHFVCNFYQFFFSIFPLRVSGNHT